MVNAYVGSYSLCGFNLHHVHPVLLLHVNFGLHFAVEHQHSLANLIKVCLLCVMAVHLLIIICHVTY
jgi:hypothetical protein